MIVDLDRAVEFLKEKDNFLILTHAHPDGDTLGCGFALCEALEAAGKKAMVYCGDSLAPKYEYLGKLSSQKYEGENIIAVDIADTKLLGKKYDEEYGHKIKLCIDHHGSNRLYAEMTLLDPKAAGACEIILEIIRALNVRITKTIADCIYTGLATDTGCFRYSNVTPRTLRMAADMIECGADYVMINRVMFETKTKTYAALEKLCLQSMKMYFNGRCAFITITRDMFEKSGSDESEVDGIAALPRQIEGVLVGVTMREKQDGSFKVSMRSHEGIDVSEICAKMNGGGHPRAAGCSVDGPCDKAQETVLSNIKSYVENI